MPDWTTVKSKINVGLAKAGGDMVIYQVSGGVFDETTGKWTTPPSETAVTVKAIQKSLKTQFAGIMWREDSTIDKLMEQFFVQDPGFLPQPGWRFTFGGVTRAIFRALPLAPGGVTLAYTIEAKS